MGHFGRDKTYAMLSTHYYWPRMKRDVELIVRRFVGYMSQLQTHVYIHLCLYHMHHGLI
jgi:hypothetical protein